MGLERLPARNNASDDNHAFPCYGWLLKNASIWRALRGWGAVVVGVGRIKEMEVGKWVTP